MVNLVENSHRDGIDRGRILKRGGGLCSFYEADDIVLSGTEAIVDHEGWKGGQPRLNITRGVQLVCDEWIYYQPASTPEGGLCYVHRDLSYNLTDAHGS